MTDLIFIIAIFAISIPIACNMKNNAIFKIRSLFIISFLMFFSEINFAIAFGTPIEEIVKSNEFPLGIKYNEDKYFTFLCMLNSKQISLIDTTPYICLSRNDSARHGVKLDDTDYIKVAEMINDKLKNCELSEIAEIHLITMIVYKIRTMMRLNESNFNKKKMFKKIRNKLNQYNTKDLKINRRLRIEIIMIECGYIVYNLFVRVADAILK